MTTWRDSKESEIRHISLQEQQVYNHLLQWVRVESPKQSIERFQRLFLDGVGYEDFEIWLALQKIVMDKRAPTEFRFVINRCCHILINHWHLKPHSRRAVQELVALFDHVPSPLRVHSRAPRRLRELMQLFKRTEQYLTLQRLSIVMSDTPQYSNGSKRVANLIQRYPYLYEHCLLSEDSSQEYQQTVRQVQARVQRRFEFDLSKYVTYQVRCAHVRRNRAITTPKRIIQPVSNPTLLTERELASALKQFVGKVQGSYTYRDVARSFHTHSRHTVYFKDFKDDLYEYLIASIDPAYGKQQFNKRLYTHLQNTLPEWDYQTPNEFMVVRTCSQLLNFLVVESPKRPHHYTFVDLITNVGTTITTGLLLKIVLLCRKVKPYLEKRFSILFNHYESETRNSVPWLVPSLENLNIALSVHFGSADLSCLKQIM
ncbi:MAG: hypothetical protein F6K65_21145 [Moorea sp. SIO3C2]|nr:hypothetical protein [Moorena sp. SIO3C2]